MDSSRFARACSRQIGLYRLLSRALVDGVSRADATRNLFVARPMERSGY